MAVQKGKLFSTLTLLLAFMASVSSLGGLFIEGLYLDNDLVTSAWHGNDLVTLCIVVPMMLLALFNLRNNSSKAKLFWLGSLWYMVYNYMFYMFGATFNNFFLLYVALFTLSTFTLIFALIHTDARKISQSFSTNTPVKWISGFMLFFAVMLGLMWIMLSLSFVITGEVHQSISQTGHTTAVVFAVDLSLLIPSLLLGGILLLKRSPWGYVSSAIVLIKATAYGLALILMTLSSYIKTSTIDPLLLLWVLLTLGCMVSLIFLLGSMNRR